MFPDRFSVGQNLYMTSSTDGRNRKVDWNTAIQSWFDEYKIYKYPGGFSKQTGHYTQVSIL